jgi:hypothetical protein
VQLKTGKCLKIKEWLSGLQMPGDSWQAPQMQHIQNMSLR